jgi:hypothetical protein
LFFILSFLLLSNALTNAAYYVSSTGSSSWGTENGECGHPETGSSNPCSLLTANNNASAGDTVILLNGVYKDSLGIWPSNSGTSEKPIIFLAESPAAILRTNNFGVTLSKFNDCKDFIIVDGFTIDNANGSKWVALDCKDGNSSVGFELKNCELVANAYYNWAGLLIAGEVSDVYIHDNIFNGGVGKHPGVADPIFITTRDDNDIIEKILIENNQISGGSHNAVMVQAAHSGTVRKLVFRNNEISNPNHTGMGFALNGRDILIENNIIFNCGSICEKDGDLSSCSENEYGTEKDRSRNRTWHGGISLLEWDHAIIRNNIVTNSGYGIGMDVPNSRNHRVYNNVFHSNTRGLEINAGSPGIYDNHFVNNVWYNNTLNSPEPDFELRVVSLDPINYRNIFRNNIVASKFLIKFSTNNDGPFLETLANLDKALGDWIGNRSDIQWSTLSDKTAANDSIGKGTMLTRAVSPGIKSKVLVVEDSKYFFDGWDIGDISGDNILIDGIPAVVSSINYNTDTITLTTETSWDAGAEIQIAHNHEYLIGLYNQLHIAPPSFSLSPPSNLRVIQF